MKVLFLYRSNRQQQMDSALMGEGVDTPLYGLNHMHLFDIEGIFNDDDRRLGIWERLQIKCSMKSERYTGLSWNIGQALKSLKHQKYTDCFFATTDSTGLPLALLKKCRFLRKPLVIATQGLCNSTDIFGWNWWFKLHKWAMGSVDHFVMYGWGEQQDLCDKFGIPQENVSWVPFGVDRKYYSEFSTTHRKENEYILSVGRDKSRDFKLLLQIASRFPSLKFRIITAENRLNGLTIPENVDVKYNLSTNELCKEYAGCKFVILPVKESSYSFATTTLLDTMNFKKAAIVSKTRATGEKGYGYGFEDRVHCCFVPPGDIGALEKITNELWKNKSLRKQIGNAGYDYSKQFTTVKLAEYLSGIFKKVQDSDKR